MSEESSRRSHPSIVNARPQPGTEDIELARSLGAPAVDVHGLPIGVIVAVYREAHTRRPAWFGISVGRCADLDIVIAPTDGATFNGSVVTIGFDRARVITTSRAVVALLADAIGDERPRHPPAQLPRCSRRWPSGRAPRNRHDVRRSSDGRAPSMATPHQRCRRRS